jgi:hypothetical protein
VVCEELGANRFRLEMNREELEHFVRLLARATGTALQQGETTLAQALMHFVVKLGIDPL